MFEQLAELLAGDPPTVFFRDDDADRDLPELRTLLSIFERHRVPLSLAVIPGSLQCSAGTLLRAAADAQPLELHQHGWMHTNHELTGRKCEFGPSRTYEQQFLDVAQGFERLSLVFQASFTSIFTPPWNRCTATTRQVLGDLGFRAISTIRSDQGIATLPALPEVPVGVDLFRWREECRLKREEELTQEIVALARQNVAIGVLLHHKVMSQKAWEALAQLLAVLVASRAQFRVMGELCPAAN